MKDATLLLQCTESAFLDDAHLSSPSKCGICEVVNLKIQDPLVCAHNHCRADLRQVGGICGDHLYGDSSSVYPWCML